MQPRQMPPLQPCISSFRCTYAGLTSWSLSLFLLQLLWLCALVWQCPVRLSCSCKACDNTCHGRICCCEYLYDFLADVSHISDSISADKLQITGPVSEGRGHSAQLSKPNDWQAGTASEKQAHEKLVSQVRIKWLLIILFLSLLWL